MIGQAQTRSIIPRALQSRATRALRAALRRLPPPVQRLGMLALTPVMKRWPTVMRLLGLAGDAPQTVASQVPRPVAAPIPKPAPAVESWLKVLRSDPEPSDRVRAVRAIAGSIVADVTSALTAALRDPSAEVAAEAADALRHHRSDSVIEGLRRAVENADGYFSAGVRAAAIRTLSAILPLGAGAPIAAAVADLDAEVSVAAIAGVVDRNEAGSADTLLTVLENPRGYYVALARGAAARGLRGLATPPDQVRLRALIEAEHDREIREILSTLVPTTLPD
jgi:HEAT repeat protein